MDLGLTGRVALVSGASKGIGMAIARSLANEGARVVVGYHSDEQGADEVVRSITVAGGSAIRVSFDLIDPDSVRTAVAEVGDTWGAVQVLVNNGGAFPQPGPFDVLSDEGWTSAIRNQLEGPGNLIRAVLPGMIGSGWGRIVSISTVHALVGNPGVVAHTAAKSGLHGLTRSLARELGSKGILVNAVLPGLTLTEKALTKFPPEHLERASSLIPTGHPSTPGDIAALVTFLGSAANGNVTGELIRSAGGL